MVVAAGTGLAASVIAGKSLVSSLEPLPRPWRQTVAWLLVGTAAVVAILGHQWSRSTGGEHLFVFLLATLPGIAAFLVFRTMLASTLVSLLPLYYVIGAFTRGRPLHMPASALDRLVPAEPASMLVYGSIYVFVLLPLLIVRQDELLRRAIKAYILVLVAAYVGFLAYPTIAPRPPVEAIGAGFLGWCLRLTYALDSPYNCFPSLHVANSFVSALACYRVHKGVGLAAALWASLIGVSTLFAKQHFAIDVIAGAALAFVAYFVFLSGYPREAVPEWERRLAPRRAVAVIAVFGLFVASFWLCYASGRVMF